MRSPWRLALGGAATLVVLVFAGRALARHWDEFERLPLDLEPRAGLIVLAALVVWASYALLIWAWRAVVIGWGEGLGPWAATRIWALSSLAKYVPGKVWALAGMVVLARDEGVRPMAATAAALLLQALALGTGAAVAGLAGLQALEAARPGARLGVVVVTAAAVAGVALLLWPATSRRLLGMVGVEQEAGGVATPAPGAVLGATLANVLAWLGYGTALWCLARGLFPAEAVPPWAVLTGAFAASYLAGLLALFAPGGVLVREALLVALLQPTLGLPRATALALASRVLLTVTEAGIALPFLGSLWRRRDPA